MATRTIGTEVKLTGEKEFNQQMKAMNSAMKTTKSDMAALSSEFEDNANSMEALTSKQKLLRTSVDQHKAKVEALTNQYKAAAATYGENSASAQKYRQQLNQATIALNKETAALEKNADAMREKYLAGLKAVASGAGNIFSGIGKGVGVAASGIAKGVGAITAASVAGVAAIATGGVMIVSKLMGMANEAAASAKAAAEAGETLTDSQQQWLAYSNQLDALGSSVENAKGALAGILLPALSELSAEGTAFLNDFSAAMAAAGSDTGAQTQVLSDYIVKGAKLIMTKLPEYAAAGKELFSGLAGSLAESGPELMEMGIDLITDLLNGIIEYAPQLAEAGIALTEQLTQSLIDRGPDLVTSAVGMVTQIVSGLAQAAPQMIPMAGQLIVTLITALVQAAPDLLIAGMELILGIISGITTGLGDIANAAGTIIETAKTAFSERASEILSLGKNIVEGIWDGISNGTEWIYGKIESWVGSVLDWIKKKLGIASPSKVMRDEVGFWMARGIGEGFEQEMRNVNQLIASSLDTSFDVPDINVGHTRYRGRSYATSGGKTVNLYVSAKTLTESDINMLIDVVNRKLGDDL